PLRVPGNEHRERTVTGTDLEIDRVTGDEALEVPKLLHHDRAVFLRARDVRVLGMGRDTCEELVVDVRVELPPLFPGRPLQPIGELFLDQVMLRVLLDANGIWVVADRACAADGLLDE